jgi:DNA polymerase III delta subunit
MGDIANIVLITGGDDYAVEATAKKAIAARVPQELAACAVETLSGEASNAESQLASIANCLASVQTPPFLDPVKLTWWKGVTFLPGGGRGGKISDEVKKALEKLADDLAKSPLPPNQFLVITAPKLLKTSLFAKKMKTIAETVEYAVPERSKDRFAAALARVNELAQEENLKFAPGANRAFVAKAGCDTRTLVSELEKMRTYLGEETREVTLDDINNVTSPGGGDIEIWALTEAMASRSAAKTLAVLKNFQGDSGWPVMISTIVERWFRDLIIAKAGGGGDDWKARKNAEAARSFSLTELRLARLRMIRLREKLVSSSPGDDYVEMEILRTLSRRQ